MGANSLLAPRQSPRIHILGAGRAGTTLAQAWVEAGTADIGLVMNRRYDSAVSAVRRIGAGYPVKSWVPAFGEFIAAHKEQPDWIMLAVPDGDLAVVAETLAQGLNESIKPVLVFHISGQLDNQVLMPLFEQGIATASAHPVLAFSQADTARQQLLDSYCLLAADVETQPQLQRLFSGIGMRCVIAPSDLDKTAYHAAMVCASNFTCALQYLAANLAQQAGLPAESALELLTNLSQHSLEGIAEHGPLDALTGPIERGDSGATRQLLSVIKRLPKQQSASLMALARTVLEMAQTKQSINHKQASQITELLDASE